MNVSATLHVYSRPGHLLAAEPRGGASWWSRLTVQARSPSFDWTVE